MDLTGGSQENGNRVCIVYFHSRKSDSSLRFKSGTARTILIKYGMLDTSLRLFPKSRKTTNMAIMLAEQARVKLPTVKLHGSSQLFFQRLLPPFNT